MSDTANYDEAWKEALDLYFRPLLSFFFPAAHALIDWQQPIQFLDKEFQQLIPAAQLGKRTVDKLARVSLLSGDPALVLIHIEVQSQEDTRFAERMFVYHYRIYDRYRQPVISLAILGDENRHWRPEVFEYELAGSQLLLRFPFALVGRSPCVKLLDYENRDLEDSGEPIAMLVMVHIKTKRTVGDPSGRKGWKWELVRRLYERGYKVEEMRRLFRLIDWMMSLPQGLEDAFRQELHDYEESRQMPLISRMERDALEQGIQQGLTQGIQQGEAELTLRQLRQKLGSLPSELETQIRSLPVERLEELGLALLEFKSLADLTSWLHSFNP